MVPQLQATAGLLPPLQLSLWNRNLYRMLYQRTRASQTTTQVSSVSTYVGLHIICL